MIDGATNIPPSEAWSVVLRSSLHKLSKATLVSLTKLAQEHLNHGKKQRINETSRNLFTSRVKLISDEKKKTYNKEARQSN